MLNKEAFSKIDLEVKKLKGEVLIQLQQMENKQKIHSESMKYILEHSGSRRLTELSQRVLAIGDSNDVFSPNLLGIGGESKLVSTRKSTKKDDRNEDDLMKYKKPTEEELKFARTEIRRRSTIKKNKLLFTVNEDSEKESLTLKSI